jgi:diguanylate cyclase (GGDEF)-like protein
MLDGGCQPAQSDGGSGSSYGVLDVLTGLPNRRLLGDRLGQTQAASKRSGLCGAVMFLDLDNFKSLNDVHGHGVGDLLLVEVAKRLSACVREVDTVARFGGDEFVVLLGELDVAEKIRLSLEARNSWARSVPEQKHLGPAALSWFRPMACRQKTC